MCVEMTGSIWMWRGWNNYTVLDFHILYGNRQPYQARNKTYLVHTKDMKFLFPQYKVGNGGINPLLTWPHLATYLVGFFFLLKQSASVNSPKKSGCGCKVIFTYFAEIVGWTVSPKFVNNKMIIPQPLEFSLIYRSDTQNWPRYHS